MVVRVQQGKGAGTNAHNGKGSLLQRIRHAHPIAVASISHGDVPWLQMKARKGLGPMARGTYLSAFYHRIARRRGKKKAIVALAHKLLVIIYHVLSTTKPYEELGADFFDQLDKARIERRSVQRLEQLGYAVTLVPKQEVA